MFWKLCMWWWGFVCEYIRKTCGSREQWPRPREWHEKMWQNSCTWIDGPRSGRGICSRPWTGRSSFTAWTQRPTAVSGHNIGRIVTRKVSSRDFARTSRPVNDNTVEPLVRWQSRDSISTVPCYSIRFKSPTWSGWRHWRSRVMWLSSYERFYCSGWSIWNFSPAISLFCHTWIDFTFFSFRSHVQTCHGWLFSWIFGIFVLFFPLIFHNSDSWMSYDYRWSGNQSKFTVLSRGVRSLFGPTRKSFPWGNFSDGGLNQSIKRRLSL